MSTDSALVLFSGGQDSTVCLAWALSKFARVETVGFDYRQRHSIELKCRLSVLERLRIEYPDWAARLADDHLVDLSVRGQISDTALTRDQGIAMSESGLPNTFVPGRNILFLTLAAALAYRRGIETLVGGMCETDYSGYPDCRRDTLDATERALSLGMDRAFRIETPLMHIDKAATWGLAQELGGGGLVDLIVEETHTCYLGERGELHPWGHGCGACPACDLRRRGWEAWSAGQA